MLFKTCQAVEVKAVGEEGSGQFEAIVSVFDNKDSYGDVVRKGAFVDTLAAWAAKGDPIPVYWSHRTDDPKYLIGRCLEAKETDRGLWVKVQLDLKKPVALDTYDALKERLVTQFSFAYAVREGAWVMKSDDPELGEYYELRKLDLYEVGPTPIGANSETELLTVKHLVAEVKAGRVLSAKNETAIRGAYDQLGQVLAALDKTDDEPKSAPVVLRHGFADLELELELLSV